MDLMELLPEDDEAAAPRTRSERIRERIADAIVRGQLAPGVALEEEELARLFGVSRTPVREAIRQLEAMGLASARPRRGAVVAAISARRLDEMFAVMSALEAACARESALKMTPAERRDLEALHRKLATVVSAGDLDAYAALNHAFHDAVYVGSQNAFLAETTAALRSRLAPFRRAQLHASLQRLAQSWGEHDLVVAAILRGDAAGAEGAMRGHVGASRRAFSQVGNLGGG